MEVLKAFNSITNKSDKLDFIRSNKVQILKEKKAMPKLADALSFDFAKGAELKMLPTPFNDNEVVIVGNSVGFMDSHKDVSMMGSWTKTVAERGAIVPIIKDHIYKVDNIFAENKGAFVSQVNISELGYSKEGMTEVLGCIIAPDADMFDKYQKGLIKQHSVGLQYIKLDLAVNDPSDEEGYKVWQSNIDKVINREMAEDEGFFFPIFEQKLIEFSAVVFGSNPYTPAFTNTEKSLENDEPLQDTQKEVKPIEQERGNEFLKYLIQ